MKQTILFILLTLLILSLSTIEAKALGPSDTVLIYFQALKHGDIETIKDSISEEMYKIRKILLEQNQNYSEILKKAYQEAEFHIKETTIDDDNAQISVEVNCSDRKRNYNIFLYKDVGENWKIYEETITP